MRHCRICNRNYADDDSFCANDGSMLAMGAAPEPAAPVDDRFGAPPNPEALRGPAPPGSEGKPPFGTGGKIGGVEKKG